MSNRIFNSVYFGNSLPVIGIGISGELLLCPFRTCRGDHGSCGVRPGIKRENHGRSLYFDDPDGYLMEIITRPYGPVTERWAGTQSG
jgi:hypothetical protein